MSKKRIFAALAILAFFGAVAAFGLYRYALATLPKLITIADYKPLLSTEVFDRNGKKIGEFFHEKRSLVPYEKIPKDLVHAFLSAEDNQFFQHGGINYLAIMRAMLANIRAGRNAQGGSTITQQVAKTLMLSNEKTYIRKIKDILLAQELEAHLKKEEILYLYLNQIYFGEGAYGIELAAQTYFRKSVGQLTLPEMAILAGLPKAPSAYSPIHNPARAKERQTYVLHRMAEDNFITPEVAEKAIKEPVKIYTREKFESYAPYYLETIRELLVTKIGEDELLDEGLKVYTSLDLQKQIAAQSATLANLKDLDKRQGFRGALKNIADEKEEAEFLLKTRNSLISDVSPERIILPEGKFQDYGPFDPKYDHKKGVPFYIQVGKDAPGIVTKIDDANGIVYIRVAELEGAIDIDTMKWARKPNTDKRFDQDQIKNPSQALKKGDVIVVKLLGPDFAPARLKKAKTPPTTDHLFSFELDQEPVAQAALISLDQDTQDVLAMVGGTDYEKSKYNRALQAARQTGSSFKSIVYTSALDKGYTPATPIMDAPIVFEEQVKNDDPKAKDEEGQDDEQEKIWKPANHSKSFGGDIIVRNALAQSLNIPAVKVIEDVKVDWAADYAKRLGIFSKLNMDFTLALGSSSVTLYEMTKVFSELGRMGKRVHPILVHRVEDSHGQKIADVIGLDERFSKEIGELDTEFDMRRSDFLAHQGSSSAAANAAAAAEKKADEIAASGTPSAATAGNGNPDTGATRAASKKQKPEEFFFFQDPEQLIRPTTAYLMTSLLKAVVEDKHGTGGAARALGREVAGKTGTSNGYYDGWFIGYTPQIATGVWVGFDQEKSLGKGEVGGRAALPIWLDYMRAAHENLPVLTFPIPTGIVFANIESDTGKLASAGSKNIVRQAFLESTEPTASKNGKEEDSDFYKEDLSN